MERRDFLRAGWAAPFVGRVPGANHEMRIGQIGLGTRGAYELEICKRTKGAKVVAVADVYQPLADKYAVDGIEVTITHPFWMSGTEVTMDQ